MSITLQNSAFGSDLRYFDIVIPPTVTGTTSLHRNGSTSADSDEPASPSADLCNYIIELEPHLVGKGRIGRVFRGVMRRQASGSSVAQDVSQSDDISSVRIPAEHVIIKLVAPLSRIKVHNTGSLTSARPQNTYHPSMRSSSVVRELLNDIKKEALFYAEELVELQGRIVPRFFGYAVSRSKDSNGDANAAVMVLEDCGRELGFSYQRLPVEDRLAIFRAEVLLHQAGISHGDVASRNFVKSLPSSSSSSSQPLPRADPTSRVRLIDFDRAKSHVCPSFSPTSPSSASSPPLSSPHSLPVTLEDLLNPTSALRAQIRSCSELEKMRIRFGLCHEDDMEMSAAQRRKFVPWDGDEWGAEGKVGGGGDRGDEGG